MLTCYLQGGLGNQLFQIFTTLNYALQHKKPFAFTNQTQLDTKRATYWQTFLAPLAKFTKPIDYRQINVVEAYNSNAYNKIKEMDREKEEFIVLDITEQKIEYIFVVVVII